MAIWPISDRLREYLEVQYELRRVLGEGGMGVVMLASEHALERQVAIKVLNKQSAAQPELRERFRREARVAARLTHPHIVPLHTFGDVDGELFFVMGFVEGETLATKLRREGTVPEAEALRILREVCDALALAHDKSIVHRDIKPENVLIEARSGRTLLADFGIAREGAQSVSLTGTGISVGTPHYMSPEQAAPSGPVDHRADIYAVGVLAYRMLSGRLPFDGANVREIITQQMVAKPRDFSGDKPDVSPHVVAAVMRCLEKDASARWPSAGSLRDAIAPSPEGEELLPEELSRIDGTAFSMVVASIASAWLLIVNHYAWQNVDAVSLLQVMIIVPLAVVPLGLGGAYRHGLRRPAIVAARPPRWWPLWWPKFARRPGDVWDRLPRPIRISRGLFFGPLMLGAPVFLTLLMLLLTLRPEQLGPFLENPVVKLGIRWLSFALAAALAAAGVMMLVWSRRAGHPRVAGNSPWLVEPVASPRWSRSDFAAVLGKPSSIRQDVPESAARLGVAIDGAVRDLVNGGVISSGEAASVARDVVKVIANIDRELALLERAGDAADLRRLDDRIEAAGSDALGAEVLEMLLRQRDGVRKILQRQDEQQDRRERLAGNLRELFVELQHVRERAQASTSGSITDRLDRVCGDLKRLASGYDEVRDSETTPMTSAPTSPAAQHD
jgi:tRNA A-37 threonylcarbamoyl transferase component Bud32